MQFAKHIWVLQKLSTIPRSASVVHSTWRGDHRPAIMTPEEAVLTWDHLFEYIHHNWDVPSSASATWWHQQSGDVRAELVDCRKMLEMGMEELEVRLESLPPYFTEAIFPVAVARYLLRDLAIPMDHRRTKTFKEFHDRYGRMILN